MEGGGKQGSAAEYRTRRHSYSQLQPGSPPQAFGWGFNSRSPSTWPGSQDSLLGSLRLPRHPLPVSQTRSAALASCGSASTGASAPPLLRTGSPPPTHPPRAPRGLTTTSRPPFDTWGLCGAGGRGLALSPNTQRRPGRLGRHVSGHNPLPTRPPQAKLTPPHPTPPPARGLGHVALALALAPALGWEGGERTGLEKWKVEAVPPTLSLSMAALPWGVHPVGT